MKKAKKWPNHFISKKTVSKKAKFDWFGLFNGQMATLVHKCFIHSNQKSNKQTNLLHEISSFVGKTESCLGPYVFCAFPHSEISKTNWEKIYHFWKFDNCYCYYDVFVSKNKDTWSRESKFIPVQRIFPILFTDKLNALA